MPHCRARGRPHRDYQQHPDFQWSYSCYRLQLYLPLHQCHEVCQPCKHDHQVSSITSRQKDLPLTPEQRRHRSISWCFPISRRQRRPPGSLRLDPRCRSPSLDLPADRHQRITFPNRIRHWLEPSMGLQSRSAVHCQLSLEPEACLPDLAHAQRHNDADLEHLRSGCG